MPLSGTQQLSAPDAFRHAEQTLRHGYLKEAQNEAGYGYDRFLDADPAWAGRFQILEAEAMARRGLNEDLIRLFADGRSSNTGSNRDSDQTIHRWALEARALTNLHRFPEAGERLREATQRCGTACASSSALLRASGMLLLERGKMPDAKEELLASLQVARANNDGIIEASDLLSLGYIASQEEHHDEALDLYQLALKKANGLGAQDFEERALGSEGWQEYSLGNLGKALSLFNAAEDQAVALGDLGKEISWRATQASVYADLGQPERAETIDLQVIKMARRINGKQEIIDASMDLAHVYLTTGKPDEADRSIKQAATLIAETGSPLDLQNVHLIQGQIAAFRHDFFRAAELLNQVLASPDSQPSMKWEAERSLANLDEAHGDAVRAYADYRAGIALVEAARDNVEHEESRLTFLTRAARIYDDFIHFLVAQGRTQEALEAADWSRARTLQQGLGIVSHAASASPPKFDAMTIARKSNSTLLFYWMGEKQSYLWAISPAAMTLIPLPPQREIAPAIERYSRALLDLKDPVHNPGQGGDHDGRALYALLIAPAAALLAHGRPVVLFADGPMSQLNFDTLVVGSPDSPASHYWIEDATLVSAPSIRIFAAARSTPGARGKMLLIGDSIPPSREFPALPWAATEIERVRSHGVAQDETIFTHASATPNAYLSSHPERFAYIHFVAHGTASRLDPLDSAIILSRLGTASDTEADDTFRLYARDILRHPIDARLVTISACNSSGSQPVAGEGLVGLSWAFLRAGAHNAIGSLWEVSDASTPMLMDSLYTGIGKGQRPTEALRNAKLDLLHSGSKFQKPFYWAPFQLYAGR